MKRKLQEFLGRTNPLILILFLVIVAEALQNPTQSIGEWLFRKLLILPGIIIGLSFHEAAHALVSYKLGDPLPKFQGRITLNPLAHIDPVGFVALLLVGFGWGIPVEINSSYYKNRRIGEFLVSLAGVVTNFLIAVCGALVIKGIYLVIPAISNYIVGDIFINIMFYVVYINLVLMVFNLLPIPPLDGFGLITQIFKLERYDWYYAIYSKGSIILLIFVILNIPSKIISPVCSFLLGILIW